MPVFRVWAAECWVWIWFRPEAGHQVDPPGGRRDLQQKSPSLEIEIYSLLNIGFNIVKFNIFYK